MSKLSGYTAITTVHADDELVVVDVHDTSMAATGTTKKMTLSQLPGAGLAVVITTTGSTFSPSVTLAAGFTTATVTWQVAGGAAYTGTAPAINFGSGGTRTVYMTVADVNGYDAIDHVTVFNIGFDHTIDAGIYSLGAGYDYPAQAVSAITGIRRMTGLQVFCADQIAGLTGTLDFSGCAALQYIEVYGSGVQAVLLAGCESLIRLDVEANNLTSLDLNPVAANIRDVRAAIQQGGSLQLAALAAASLPVDYHLCVRDQTATGLPVPATPAPGLQQLWVWNTRQSGAFTPAAPDLNSVLAWSNKYTSADLTNQMTSGGGEIDLSVNSLTACNLAGCTGLSDIQLTDNAFAQATVDGILATVAGFGTSGGTLALTGNAAPSGAGTTSAGTLTGRGWTVTTGPGALTVVQSASAAYASSVSFSNPVTSGNTVIYIVGAYTTAGAAISSSAPRLNSAAVTGAAAAFNPGTTAGISSPFQGNNGVYLTAWMLPNCPAANGLSLTLTNAGGPTGVIAYEVHGLAATPVIEAAVSGSNAASTAIDAGRMNLITAVPVIAVGAAQAWNNASTPPAAPWTCVTPVGQTVAGYRFGTLSDSEAYTFTWALNAASAGEPWSAALIAVH